MAMRVLQHTLRQVTARSAFRPIARTFAATSQSGSDLQDGEKEKKDAEKRARNQESLKELQRLFDDDAEHEIKIDVSGEEDAHAAPENNAETSESGMEGRWDQFLEDDRLRMEKPGGEGLIRGSSFAEESDPFRHFQAGDIYAPSDLNWMKKDQENSKPRKVKPAKYFREANQDDLELALNPDLLRVFLTPTGRIQPRRFTGLSAKEQRKLTRAIKVSRNLALLPFTSRYPLPSDEQMDIMDQEIDIRHQFGYERRWNGTTPKEN